MLHRYQIKGLHEIHMHAEYEVCRWKDDKIISNAKVANRQTDKETDRAKTIRPAPLWDWGHKNEYV